MMLLTAFQNAKTRVNGCRRPSSWGATRRGTTGGGDAGGTGGGSDGGGGGGSEESDSIIASDHRHQFVAHTSRFPRIQTRNNNAGMLSAGGVQQQRCESERTFDRPTVQVNVLQS